MKKSENNLFQYKTFILESVKAGKWDDAHKLICQYLKSNERDADIYSIEASICMLQERYDEALKLLKSGYRLDSENINLLINFATTYEKKGDIQRSLNFYRNAMDIAVGKFRGWLESKIVELSGKIEIHSKYSPPRIMFFVKPALDSFLDDIIFSLMGKYEVRKCIVKSKNQIDAGIDWADICWFEWCNELTAYASRHKSARQKKIINRIHRIDLHSPYRDMVEWENIDNVIVVNDHIKSLLIELIGNKMTMDRVAVIQNGIDLDRFKFKIKSGGFNLAFAAIFRLVKNPSMPLQILRKLLDIDKRYRLFVAGTMQDPWAKMYWDHQIEKMGLSDHVVFDHWQKDMDQWLDDKDYLLSTSFYESFGYTIAEAMTKGIKPVIHDFPSASESWPKHLLFNTIDEACELISERNYQSEEYRNFIDRNYKMEDKMNAIRSLIAEQCRPAVVNE